jgi:di/tricarboxylate transporter
MSTEAIFVLIVIAIMFVALVRELFAPDVIVFSALGILYLSDVLTTSDAFIGFSNKGMLTVAILFIIAYAAQSSGLLEWLAAKIMGRSTGGRRSLVRMMLPVLGLSAFLNNTPVVAMFVPAIRDWATKKHIAPSKFLIPLSYASIFGGVCTLIGTSTNLVVNGLFQQSYNRSISMFELAYVGLPCALAGISYFLLVGYRTLPDRSDPESDFSESGREYLLEMAVQGGGPLVGKTIEQAGLRNLDQLFLAEIIRGGETITPVKPGDRLCAEDLLVFAGQVAGVVRLQSIQGLTLLHGSDLVATLRKSGDGRVLEAVVSRSSPMLGHTLKEGDFRARYDAVVLAAHRNGERLATGMGHLALKPGDTLLLLAGKDFLKRWRHARDFYMVSKVTDLPQIDRRKSIISVVTLVGMILLSAFEVIPIFKAAILAAMVLLFTRCLTVVEARRSLELNVLIIIACSFGLSRALEKTGAADFLATHLINSTAFLGPVVLLAAVYFITSLMTEMITNNAAAALAFPIAMSAATQSGLDPKPFVIAIAVAASASFATPIGYQTNLMVYGPGGYRFSDFLRVGIPMNMVFMAVALFVIPLVWPF